MKSENYTVEAPLSFAGSARRIWRVSEHIIWRLTALFVLIPMAWCVVMAWYCTFGLLVVPYRLVRRSQRKQKLADLRHKEMVEAVGRESRIA